MEIKISDTERYAFADLAAGKDARKSRKRRSRQVIVVGSRDWLARWFWIYIWAGYETTSDFKERLIRAHETYDPRLFGLEANGMQVLFGSLVRDEAKERLGRSKFVPIYQPTKVEKNYRIRTGFEPPLDRGQIFIQNKEIEARSEIAGFPTSMYKDIIDALETCMNRVAPKRVKASVEDHERDEYAAYLRTSGLPAHLIAQEVEMFDKSEGNVIQFPRRRGIMVR